MDQEKQDVGKGYALVTGSGAGLGLAFVHELASRGYPLVMVSLPGEDLAGKAAGISEKYGVDVLYLEQDLVRDNSVMEMVTWLHKRGVEVTVLINNAGIGSTQPFLEFQPDFYTAQLKVNVITTVLMCRVFLEKMLLSPKPCYILNVGSLGGYFHLPNKEVYGASKAFVHSFTAALQLKVLGTNVSLIAISPGPVETNARIRAAHVNMKGLAKKAVMLPEDVARQSLDAMFAGKKTFVPGKINRLFLALDWIVPSAIKNRILLKEMKRQASFTR